MRAQIPRTPDGVCHDPEVEALYVAKLTRWTLSRVQRALSQTGMSEPPRLRTTFTHRDRPQSYRYEI